MIEQLDRMMQELADIEFQLGQPDVASDQKTFKKLNTEHSRLSGIKEKYDRFKELKAGIEQAKEVLETDDDPEMREMAKAELGELEAELVGSEEELQFTLVPPDPSEGKDVIVEIRAGTGGDEAALFVGDLYKMYLRYAEQSGLKTEIVNTDSTGIGGYKEVVFAVKGGNAYSDFIGEGGGHRVQRIPATESGGRIHTSAATVAVLPEVEETEVEIKDADLRVDYYRSSGPGGQSVNTTDSAVRLTHVPTGIIVTCQDEKSQHKNKAKAMRIMRARVYEREMAAKKAEADASKKAMIGSGDRSQRIRTYNFPQNRVTDHRIGFTSHNLDKCMAGDMSELVGAITKARKQEMLDALNKK